MNDEAANDPAGGKGKDLGIAKTSERARDDVNDDQPYANRGPEDRSTEPSGLDDEYAQGDRGERSGNNLAQLEQVRTPPKDRR